MPEVRPEPAGSPLVGALNFRDLGGLPTGDGRRLRPGVLVRSDTLQALTAADVDFLVTSLRLTLIVDLRAGPEAVGEGRGPMADTGVCYLNAPLRDLSPADGVPPDEQALRFSLDHLAAPASPLPTVVRVLCALAGRPVLVHYAAGKDRTGLVVALLLRLIGVRDEQIVADYLRTAAHMDRIVAASWAGPATASTSPGCRRRCTRRRSTRSSACWPGWTASTAVRPGGRPRAGSPRTNWRRCGPG